MGKLFDFGFKDRPVMFWVSLAATALWVAATLFYLIYSLSVGLLRAPILIVMLLGAAAGVFATFGKAKFVCILSSVLFALAFGLFIDDRVEMFAYMSTGIYGISGETTAILECVIAILIIMAIALLASVVSSFGFNKKEEEN